MATHDPDLIWIEEARFQYERSRPWIQQHVRAVRIPGDKRLYVRHSDMRKALAPRETPPAPPPPSAKQRDRRARARDQRGKPDRGETAIGPESSGPESSEKAG